MSLATGRKHHNLLVLQASRLGESEYAQVREVFAQQSCTFRQWQLGDDENQHAASLEPAIAVFKEDQFQSLIVALSGFPIVRRVQVEQGHRFRRAPDVHGVSLQSIDSQGSCLFEPIGVDLDAIAMSASALQQVSECHSVANTRIECGEF